MVLRGKVLAQVIESMWRGLGFESYVCQLCVFSYIILIMWSIMMS